ncbi:MAG: hypothetical protein COX29_01970 [Candidatus Moranbacteria bacterium CG23_combo_of_CG06-09_8_20_14_all_35_22]|nr:MAG: hypothetical protein COX29_01970 [Candidatus Moranbacteria bacterium CG23_combo_of_CG06-09_8_20_14_all_35_22]
MKKSNIKEVILAITYKCNSRCQMCGIWKKTQPEEISLDVVKKIPSNLKNINITGGEPFLHQDIVEIVKILNRKSPNASIIISSNGFAKELILSKIREIIKIKSNIGVAISIDGLEEIHDRVRGVPSGFKKAISTLEELKKIGVKKLRISFTLGDYNIDQLRPVYLLSQKIGIEMSLTLVHSGTQYFNTQNFVNKKEKMIEVLDWLIKQELSSWNLKRWLRAYYTYGMKIFILTKQRILPDYSGMEGIFINPNGKIFSSDISEQILGDLKNFDFTKTNELKIKNEKPSWMICTARTAIKKHWIKAGFWILKNKFL